MLADLCTGLKGLFDLLLPACCPLCGVLLAGGASQGFCPDCLEGFRPLDRSHCPRCALPYPAPSGSNHLCESCLRQDPPFVWTRCLGLYEQTLRAAVHRFKFQNAVHLDRPLARLLAASLEDVPRGFRPDVLVAVPLHRRRLQARTYNHSLLLARELGRLWKIPAPGRLLRRVRPTLPQQGLSAKLRRRNLRGAFALTRPLEGERILLVDDVLTTGATARECAATLLAGGASRVAVAVLARARLHQLL
ncbi:ComF family protein [Syntrophotalea acetylenica]|uniref:ComF family protein n=1 Tax=Syntrophotalea acetylenica TaxID=29542 RepID=A0A1L3GGS2_SYNAC|nr:ComF family protein [Syntrophotalea acetylenica]APG25055.1 hypothetical protein A7E75_08535 [Syntrophotalea acetylenica]APG43126.1 hypothetical protein A6070_02505 [Syntrophotalea acetylenica]